MICTLLMEVGGKVHGIEAADRGEFASPERAKAMFAKWGVAVEA